VGDIDDDGAAQVFVSNPGTVHVTLNRGLLRSSTALALCMPEENALHKTISRHTCGGTSQQQMAMVGLLRQHVVAILRAHDFAYRLVSPVGHVVINESFEVLA
jgi:hypothetical protein